MKYTLKIDRNNRVLIENTSPHGLVADIAKIRFDRRHGSGEFDRCQLLAFSGDLQHQNECSKVKDEIKRASDDVEALVKALQNNVTPIIGKDIRNALMKRRNRSNRLKYDYANNIVAA